MKKYISLTKIILKSGMGQQNISSSNKKKKGIPNAAKLVLQILLFLCMVPVAVMLGSFGRMLFDGFESLGAANAGYDLIGFVGSAVTLFFAFPFVLSVFFMSSDLEKLLPLPIRPSTIVAAKFTSVMLYEYMIVILMYAPMMIGYGIGADFNVSQWIMVALATIFVPFFPVCIASIIAIIMTRLLKNVKNKEGIVTGFSFLLAFGIVGLSMGVNGQDPQLLIQKLTANDQIASAQKYIFPNLTLLSKAIAENNWLQMLLYVLSVAAIMAVFLFLAEKLYLSGARGMREGSSSVKALSAKQHASVMKQRSPMVSYMKKEWRTLVRSPEYFMNCLLMPIVLPLIMGASAFFAVAKQKDAMQELQETKGSLFEALADPNILGAIIILVMFVFALFVCSSNFTTVTSISREGKGYINMKYIPMSYRDQLHAKALFGLITSAVLLLPYMLAVCAAAIVVLKANAFAVIISCVVALLFCAFNNYVQLLIDLMAPKLIWETEQGAIKQNMNTVIAMLGMWVFGGLIGAGGYFLFAAIGNVYIFGGIACAIMAAITLILRYIVFSYGTKKLELL